MVASKRLDCVIPPSIWRTYENSLIQDDNIGFIYFYYKCNKKFSRDVVSLTGFYAKRFFILGLLNSFKCLKFFNQ